MAGRRAGTGLALAAIALSAAGCGIGGSTKTVTVRVIHTRTVTTTVTTTVSATTTSAAMSACTGGQLSGTFKEASGGGGAGQIEYTLMLQNISSTTCTLSGYPAATLLDKSGSPLPTHVVGSSSGSSHVVMVVSLAPYDVAQATARFSPDVPGTGDSQSGACQPKAYTLRVRFDVDTADAPVKPPTSVCERGTLNFSAYAPG